jgi:hypothetical protein
MNIKTHISCLYSQVEITLLSDHICRALLVNLCITSVEKITCQLNENCCHSNGEK